MLAGPLTLLRSSWSWYGEEGLDDVSAVLARLPRRPKRAIIPLPIVVWEIGPSPPVGHPPEQHGRPHFVGSGLGHHPRTPRTPRPNNTVTHRDAQGITVLRLQRGGLRGGLRTCYSIFFAETTTFQGRDRWSSAVNLISPAHRISSTELPSRTPPEPCLLPLDAKRGRRSIGT